MSGGCAPHRPPLTGYCEKDLALDVHVQVGRELDGYVTANPVRLHPVGIKQGADRHAIADVDTDVLVLAPNDEVARKWIRFVDQILVSGLEPVEVPLDSAALTADAIKQAGFLVNPRHKT